MAAGENIYKSALTVHCHRLGNCQGMRYRSAEIEQLMEAAEPTPYAIWFSAPHLMRFPGGDSLQELVSRSADALRLVLERHRDGTVVLVSHDSINRALLLQLADLPLSSYWRLVQGPCCINEIDVVHGRVLIRRINDTSHLDDIESS
jgi:probable phosphoglycerate mutase